MKQFCITPLFVELIPTHLEDGVLYISDKYGTAIHKCCCGCGQEVVTPLSSAQWQLRRAGGKVTLFPSIGNWNFSCQSHYWIKQNRVEWAGSMTDRQIKLAQERDIRDLQRLTAESNLRKFNSNSEHLAEDKNKKTTRKYWQIILHWIYKL